MLSYDEVLGYVRQLSTEERLALIEATVQMVKEDLHVQGLTVASSEKLAAWDSASESAPIIREDLLHLDEERLKAQGVELRGTPVTDILGIGWSAEKGNPPTDQENREGYLNYLEGKYS